MCPFTIGALPRARDARSKILGRGARGLEIRRLGRGVQGARGRVICGLKHWGPRGPEILERGDSGGNAEASVQKPAIGGLGRPGTGSSGAGERGPGDARPEAGRSREAALPGRPRTPAAFGAPARPRRAQPSPAQPGFRERPGHHRSRGVGAGAATILTWVRGGGGGGGGGSGVPGGPWEFSCPCESLGRAGNAPGNTRPPPLPPGAGALPARPLPPGAPPSALRPRPCPLPPRGRAFPAAREPSGCDLGRSLWSFLPRSPRTAVRGALPGESPDRHLPA